MRYIHTLLAVLLLSSATYAQRGNWHKLSFEKDGVFGANIKHAHALASEMTPARDPVTVALIGGGIDVSHPAIRQSIWVNIYQNQNDWTNDSRYGWNFLGNDTTTINGFTSRMGDREFLRLRDKYNRYLFVQGDVAFTFDTETNELVQIAPPADREEFEYFQFVVTQSELGQTYRGITIGKATVAHINRIDREMRELFSDREELTRQDFSEFNNLTRIEGNQMQKVLNFMSDMMFVSIVGDSWDDLVEFANTQLIPFREEQHRRAMNRLFPRERAIIGDNPYDINQRNYGNHNLFTNNALRSTMMAGIIGGGGDSDRIQGISQNVRIMTLRIESDSGDPHLKDMALAIRYAIDHGADIIQLGTTGQLFPREQGQWVNDALREAEERGILVVIPMMDRSMNVDYFPFFPNRNIEDGTLSNVITVAASDSLGNPFLWANFSETELDLFAPGVGIESAMPRNRYATDNGSHYAATVVTGVAALLKNYFPDITPAEIRQLLIDTVTDRGDAEVEKQYRVGSGERRGQIVRDLFLFSDLSLSNGILNAGRAFEEAKRRLAPL